jgi:RNA polymerase sigma-70 factor (ECF subfamily)
MSRRAFAIVATCAALAAPALAAGPALAASHAAKTPTITVTAVDFKFTLSKSSAPKGGVTFEVTNKGKTAHDFKIDGKKTALLQPGKKASLTVTFAKAGKFPYLCGSRAREKAGHEGGTCRDVAAMGRRPGRAWPGRRVRSTAVTREPRGAVQGQATCRYARQRLGRRPRRRHTRRASPRRCVPYVLYLTGDRATADDLTAQTFETALRAWGRYDARRGSDDVALPDRTGATLDHLRSEQRRRRREDIYTADAGESAAEPRFADCYSPELEGALRALTAGEREVVALRLLLDLDATSAARVLGISRTACSMRLGRALRKLEEGIGAHALA